MLSKFVLLSFLLFTLNTYSQTVTYPSFGKGLNVVAADSSGTIKINVRIQNLVETSHNSETNITETSAMVRRCRLKFGGFAMNPDLRYKLELGLSNRDQGNSSTSRFGSEGSNIVFDAVIKYYLFENFDVWFGQTKLPGNRERVISSGDMQLVDRSLLNSRFNIDRDAGLQFRYQFGTDFIVKPKIALTTGEGRNITDDNFGGFAYTFHFDILPFGDFEDYESSSLEFTEEHKFAISGAFCFNNETSRQGGQIGNFVYDTTGNLVTNDLYSYFADLHYKYKNISIMSEYASKRMDKKLSNLTRNFISGEAFNFQIGYLFRNYWEIATRYTFVKPDHEYSSVSKLAEYTIGVSKYFQNHNLKLQTDFSYFDLFGNLNNEDFRFRMQFELQL